MTARNDFYWLKASVIPGSPWTNVTKEEWIRAERAAGFHPNIGDGCATGGFSNSGGVSGAITYDGKPPRHS